MHYGQMPNVKMSGPPSDGPCMATKEPSVRSMVGHCEKAVDMLLQTVNELAKRLEPVLDMRPMPNRGDCEKAAELPCQLAGAIDCVHGNIRSADDILRSMLERLEV